MNTIKRIVRALFLTILRYEVRRLFRGNNVRIVGVTGSMGKTTTKLAIAEVLKQKYRVLAHSGNYNTEFGLPLSLFERSVPSSVTNGLGWLRTLAAVHKAAGRPYPYEVVVLELGADRPGDIADFLSYLRLDIGVVTAIAPAHVEQFGSIEAITKEKMLVARDARFAVLNADDSRVMAAKPDGTALATYGLQSGDVRVMGITRSKDATLRASVRYKGEVIKLSTQLIARHGLYAVGAAVAVAQQVELSDEQVVAGVAAITPTAGRMQPLSGRNGSVIIDDSYNANPDAVIAALGTLLEVKGKHIAILGSMNELGFESPQLHQRVGSHCGGLDMLVTIGNDANTYLAPAAIKAGLKKGSVHTFDSPYAAGAFVQAHLEANTVVLVKGSQNRVYAEEAAALLLADDADIAKLVRQSPVWIQRKQKQFEGVVS